MTNKIYYVENTTELDNTLESIENTFPCFVEREYIEMDYSQINIKAREEDIVSIEKILAPLV